MLANRDKALYVVRGNESVRFVHVSKLVSSRSSPCVDVFLCEVWQERCDMKTCCEMRRQIEGRYLWCL